MLWLKSSPLAKFLVGGLGLLIAVALLAWGTVYVLHREYQQGYAAGYDAYGQEVAKAQAALDKQALQVRETDKAKEAEVLQEHASNVEYIYIKGETIIKEIPVYVPQKADDGCTVTLGAVRMLDAAWSGGNAAAAQDPASEPDH